MSEVIQNPRQEFWRSPTLLEPLGGVSVPPEVEHLTEACVDCGSEFMIGARFCHVCGSRRPTPVKATTIDAAAMAGIWTRNVARARIWVKGLAASRQKISVPGWLRYLEFHEIQLRIGLPTVSLIAFIIGLGCVAGAIGVSLFYKASNLAEFQAIQMWRIEWLLGATAAFVAGILLKPSSNDRN